MSPLPDRVADWLPVLVPATLIGYAWAVTIGGRILRRRRRRNFDRVRNGGQPWHRWLDEINRDIAEEKKPGAIEKWRE